LYTVKHQQPEGIMKKADRGDGEFVERREEVHLWNSVFNGMQTELSEMDKHEILVKICGVLGPCPSNFQIAEEIFEQLKFDIAKHVIHHEYCKENPVRSKLLLWLDSKINPANATKLENFCSKYLK